MANMFRCVLASGGTGSGGTIMVTCDAAFAGLTISCSDNTNTYTQTCPSTSPYTVTFENLYPETWTISGTISGTTYTATKEIPSYYPVSLNSGFDWQAWVDESVDLDSSDYVDLDELLADESAVRELCLVHACVDYMCQIASVDSTLTTIINNDLFAKWVNLSDYALDTLYANSAIKAVMDTADKYGYGEWVIIDNTTTPPTWGPKGAVPVMTGNSAPYGTAFGSTANTGSYYTVFDGDDTSIAGGSHLWGTNTFVDAYVGYTFTNPIKVNKVKLVNAINGYNQGRTKTFKVQGSNTGDTNDWHDISSSLVLPSDADAHYFTFSNDEYYLKYRVFISDNYTNNSSYIGLVTLQFYGRQLSVSVPVMTSNTAPYGEASASSSNANAYKAFVHDNSTTWMNESSDAVSSGNTYIQYSFGNKTAIKFVRILAGSYYPENFKLLGSDDSTFEEIGSYSSGWSGTPSGSQIKCISVNENNKAFKKIRFNPTTAVASSGYPTNTYVNMDIQFYGVDYSEKEFEAGATKKWLYDHGLELETISTWTNGSGGAYAIKDNEELSIGKSANGGNATLYATLNLSLYSLVRAKIYNCEYDYPAINLAVGTLSSTVTTVAVSEFTNSNIPYNNGLDISSISVLTDVGIYMNGAGTKTTMTINELWVE